MGVVLNADDFQIERTRTRRQGFKRPACQHDLIVVFEVRMGKLVVIKAEVRRRCR